MMPAGTLCPHLPTLCKKQHSFFSVLRGSRRICTEKWRPRDLELRVQSARDYLSVSIFPMQNAHTLPVIIGYVLFSKNHGHSVPAPYFNIAPSHVNDSNSHLSRITIALFVRKEERKIAKTNLSTIQRIHQEPTRDMQSKKSKRVDGRSRRSTRQASLWCGSRLKGREEMQ